MEQILQAYGLSKKTVTAKMIFYKNTKAKVSSPDDYFDIGAGVLQGDILYLSIICLEYKLQKSIDLIKENGFT